MAERNDFGEKWKRFSEWIHCVCVVAFDLELGQVIESVHPAHESLSERDRSNLCYLAFPDSNSGCMGDTRFHVRLRSTPCDTFNDTNDPRDPTHFWGFVHFRQVKDPTLPRGYFQKSVVVLTRLPFVDLMYAVCGLLAREFFDDGVVRLEAGCHQIDRWPPPRPGETLQLPLLGASLAYRVPPRDGPSQATAPAPSPCPSLSLQTPSPLAAVASDLHLLWELVLTAEPLVVTASSPAACSAAVQALVDLIHPLRYCADFRPYFTIHDSEFKEFTKKQRNPPRVILGVTNPFFSKTLDHWPHTVRLDGAARRSRGAESGSVVRTRHRPFLVKDKAALKRLSAGSGKSEAQAALVRRHALELTHSFMIPLERYMASLMPLQKNVSAFRAAPAPHPFNPDDFMSMLQQSGPHLTCGVKGDWAGLYRAFLKSPNFGGWFQRRYGELARALQALQLETLASTDLSDWAAGRQEVELVDMVLKLRKTVALSADLDLPLKSNTVSLLAEKLDDITRILPDDLKSILQNNT